MTTIATFAGEHAFLSNFHPSPITVEGEQFATIEHAFQAAKTLERAQREAIRNAPTPGKAKRLGRASPLRPDWEQIKEPTMFALLRLKFQEPRLAALLVATGHAELVEGNHWHDNVWGACTCANCPPGQNILGQLLMQVRAEIR